MTTGDAGGAQDGFWGVGAEIMSCVTLLVQRMGEKGPEAKRRQKEN